MTTISSSLNWLTLSSPPDVNPIVVAPGVTIGFVNTQFGIYGLGGSWTIQNHGTLVGFVDGVSLRGTADMVVNFGSIGDVYLGDAAGCVVTRAAPRSTAAAPRALVSGASRAALRSMRAVRSSSAAAFRSPRR